MIPTEADAPPSTDLYSCGPEPLMPNILAKSQSIGTHPGASQSFSLLTPRDIDIVSRRWPLLAAAAFAFALAAVANAQVVAKVNVDLAKDINILTSTSLGTNAKLFDGNSFNLDTAQYLKIAGLSTIRFPGSNADLYHWSIDKAAPYKGADPAYLVQGSDFGNVAQLIDKTGTAVIVVDYGTNQAGTGGGEPAEAAAWVAYANGDPSSTQPIGKDSTGKDWQTVGYWATLRTQAALPTDDGLNFLRISRPSPIKIRMWQIGSQVYNNGYYGGDHVGEPDLHGPSPSAIKDFGKLKKNPNLSPGFYGDRIVEFAKAMKAVDPTIQIGASLVTPPDQTVWASDWNPTVLKHACKDIDFVSLDWTIGKTMPPTWDHLDEGDALSSVRSQLNSLLTAMLYDDKGNCPAGHTPRISFSSASVITWPKLDHPVSLALWAADTYALLVESGSPNISWPDMYSDSMLSGDRKRVGSVYSGLQMLHVVAHAPGDVLVDASSSNPSLAVHAVKRRDGITGVMLINKDASAPITVKLTLSGAPIGTKGLRFDYGADQQKAGTGLVRSEIKDVGAQFSVTVAPYSITDVLIGN